MDFNALNSLYMSLLGFEITVLGIVLASFLVVLQLTSYSSFNKPFFFFNKISFWAYSISSLLCFSLTIIIAFKSLFINNDLISAFDFGSKTIIQNPILTLVISLVFCFSFISSIFLIFDSIKMISPKNIIEHYRRRVNPNQIRQLLLKKYGIRKPSLSDYYTKSLEEKLEKMGIPTISNSDEKANQSREREKNRAKYLLSKAEKRYEDLSIIVDRQSDIFEDIQVLVNKAIVNADIRTVKAACSLLEFSIDKVMETLVKQTDVEKEWDPYSRTLQNLGLFTSEWFEYQMKVCLQQEALYLSEYFIKTSVKIIVFSLESNNKESMNAVLKSWSFWLEHSIRNKDFYIYTFLLKAHFDAINFTLRNIERFESDQIISDVFRSIGSAARKVVHSSSIEPDSMMQKYYKSEFSQLMNFLNECNELYKEALPHGYPLIFFDILLNMIDDLNALLKKESDDKKNIYIKNRIETIFYMISSYAEASIDNVKNSSTILSIMRMGTIYSKMRKPENKELCQNFMEEMTKIAVKDFLNPQKSKDNMLGKYPYEELLGEMIKCPQGQVSIILKTIKELAIDMRVDKKELKSFNEIFQQRRRDYINNVANRNKNSE